MNIEYEKITDKIIDEAKRRYAEWIEVRIENLFFERIHLLNGRLKETSISQYIGVGIRILKDGKIGFASTSGLDINDIIDTVSKAISLSKINPVKTVLNREVFEGEYSITGYKYHPREVEYEKKIEIIKTLEEGLKDHEGAMKRALFKPDNFKQESISVRYGGYYGEIYIRNSDGTRVLFKPLLSGVVTFTTIRGDGKYGDSSETLGGSMGLDNVMDMDRLYELGVKTLSKALEKTVAGYVEAGDKRVISAPRITGVFAHESFGHMSEADHIVAKASPLGGRIGEKLGSEYATIVDSGISDYGGYYYPVDSEGIEAKRVELLKNGVLSGYLTDRETSSILNMNVTGNGRAESYSYPPIVRMRNTYFMPGDWDLDEMIKEIGNGIYVDDERGGEVNLDGTFTFTAGRGYIIENGEIKRPVRDIILTGNILEMLKYIEGATKEIKVEAIPFGGCGKGGQSVFVGLGGPYLYISRLKVGGR